jgi:hypothetical protein
MMRVAYLPRKAVAAFRSAGATEEMIAGARLIYGSLPNEPPGRQRMYKTAKEADHAFYIRKRDKRRKMLANTKKNGKATHALSLAEVKAIAMAHPRQTRDDETLRVNDETTWRSPPVLSLKELLVNAARGNVDRAADVLTIRAMLDKGCDLEADVLPVVARTVPELPRPLKNWGAQWLLQEILAARDKREVAREPPREPPEPPEPLPRPQPPWYAAGDAISWGADPVREAPREPPERPEPPSYATPELLAAVTFKEVEAPPANGAAAHEPVETPLARDRRLFPTLALRRPLADEDYDASGVSPVDAALNICDGGVHALRPAPEMARSDFRRAPAEVLRHRRPPDACRPWIGTNSSRRASENPQEYSRHPRRNSALCDRGPSEVAP